MGFYMVFLLHRKREKAIVIVRAFMKPLGEWSRIQHAMIKFRRGVVVLQNACRRFLALKRKRCSAIMHMWVHVEDHQLVEFFKLYTSIVMAEANARATETRSS